MIILGIETSCDDTGVAIIEVSGKQKPIFDILSNVVSSQIKVHAKFGGVVPNLAAREHLKNIEPCLKTALNEARIKPEQIDLIAVTIGPGLIPSLLIGTNFAKTLAYVWKKPIIGVNHIEAHIIAALAATNPKSQILNPKSFPAIALVVSGGHTQLILMNEIGKYKILGETRDDAAGECFDKVAKLLGLGYPGGPAIAKEAKKLQATPASPSDPSSTESERGREAGRANYKLNLPRPMIKHKNYDFSFSGLKTAVLYLTKDNKNKLKNKKFIQGLCHEVQQAIIDVLIEKTIRATKEYKAKTIILSGGVAANEELRKQFKSKIHNLKSNIQFLVPPKNFCTDNAAMVAMTGYFKYKFNKSKFSWKNIRADANLRIG